LAAKKMQESGWWVLLDLRRVVLPLMRKVCPPSWSKVMGFAKLGREAARFL
jgi:hypothetical protein